MLEVVWGSMKDWTGCPGNLWLLECWMLLDSNAAVVSSLWLKVTLHVMYPKKFYISKMIVNVGCVYKISGLRTKYAIAFKNYSVTILNDHITLVKQKFLGYRLLKGTLGTGDFQFIYDLYIGEGQIQRIEQVKVLYFSEKTKHNKNQNSQWSA